MMIISYPLSNEAAMVIKQATWVKPTIYLGDDSLITA